MTIVPLMVVRRPEGFHREQILFRGEEIDMGSEDQLIVCTPAKSPPPKV
ncbi:MAG: hypothetical protein L7U72_05540 [Rubripirellula sp.]|nr:hypothetical protein [Rubripirellula sp.]